MIKGMPAIPELPGGAGGVLPAGVDALIGFGGAFVIGAIFGEQWGLFNEYGVPVLLADNVRQVEFNRTANVASAPLERGTFASYNKIDEPYTASVVLTKGSGGSTGRGLFITQLETIAKSTLLYNVLTPEYVHKSATITRFSYKRTATDGARMIIASIQLKEIRQVSVELSCEESVNPEDAATATGGEVQPKPTEPNKSMLKKISENADGFLKELF